MWTLQALTRRPHVTADVSRRIDSGLGASSKIDPDGSKESVNAARQGWSTSSTALASLSVGVYMRPSDLPVHGNGVCVALPELERRCRTRAPGAAPHGAEPRRLWEKLRAVPK